MKLFKLCINGDINSITKKEKLDLPYVFFYTSVIEVLIAANTEEEARKLCIEASDDFGDILEYKDIFTNPKYSSCEELDISVPNLVYCYSGTG